VVLVKYRRAFLWVVTVFPFLLCVGRGVKMADAAGKKVLMIIAEKDFRDEELKEPRRILEAAGMKVTLASTSLGKARGMLGYEVQPDVLLKDVKVEEYDAVVFVGGSGSSQYWNDALAHKIANEAYSQGKLVGAICIAPVTLANAGLLEGKKATVWPSEAGKLEAKGAEYTGRPVERDGRIITGSGPQAAEEFGRTLLSALQE